MKLNRKTWFCHTATVCILIILLFLLCNVVGYFGLRDEWMRNDGWSHRPLLDYLNHQDFFGDLFSGVLMLGVVLLLYWLMSFGAYLIVNFRRKPLVKHKAEHMSEVGDILNNMPPKPRIWGEITLCFDFDFDVDEITGLLGVKPYDAGRQSAQRVNPYTGERNPGYWEYRTDVVSDYDCGNVLEEMHCFVTEHKDILLQIRRDYPCDVFFRVYTDAAGEADAPAIRLEQPFLRQAMLLDAAVDVIVELERRDEWNGPIGECYE